MKTYSTYYYKCKLVRENGVKFETIHDSQDVVSLVQKLDLMDASEEYMYLICLDIKGQAIGYHEISHGDLSATSASPREIFKRAVLNNAAGVILVHNHPSGFLSHLKMTLLPLNATLRQVEFLVSNLSTTSSLPVVNISNMLA